jgi:hypothetical protein
LVKFADDTKVRQEVEEEGDRRALQSALDNLCAWSDNWGMQFNIKKCKVMHFGRNNPKFVYKMNGESLEEVDVERDIGVTVHSDLKPSAQCQKAAATARTVISQITRTFHYRDKYTFLKLYKTYVRPHLEFSTPAWSPWSLGDKQCIEKVQMKVVSMISGLTTVNYPDRLKELGLESLEERRHQADMVLMHKIVHGVGNLDIGHWFDTFEGRRATRAGADPLNVRARTGNLELRKGFFSNRVAQDWNNVPSDLKNILVTGNFRAAYRKLRTAAWRPQ